jgi:hypothetical protein
MIDLIPRDAPPPRNMPEEAEPAWSRAAHFVRSGDRVIATNCSLAGRAGSGSGHRSGDACVRVDLQLSRSTFSQEDE